MNHSQNIVDKIKIIELFSGIGGFSKGLEQAGFEIEKHYFSEIDKHAIANYKYNYPNAEYIGSVVDIRPGDFRDIDIITFGSPCQDFSLAGKRKGLDGERSSLIEYAIRMVTDIRPSIFIWENVKGAFSSNSGADFWAILQAFANIGNYRLEWQLLNTKWFLPQNRERIYLIGHLADRSEPGVFPITENDARIDERAIETRSIRTLTAGGNSGGLHSSMTLVKTLQGNDTLNTIRSGGRGSLTYKHSWDNVVISSFTRDKKGKVVNRNDRNICNTITSATGSGGSTDVFVNNIRRLTEIECERLQGFPDDWTRFGIYLSKKVNKYIFGKNKKWRTEKATHRLFIHAVNSTELVKKEIPATQRYKMLGNAVTVKVVEEIAKRFIIYKNEPLTKHS